MSINTQSNRTFIESEQYSSFILENMHDGLLPSNFYRNVSDFGSGEVLNIKTIGEAQIQEVEEDAALVYSPIETGEVELRITEYIGDAWYVTDKMRQDGAQIEQLLAVRGKEATRAIQEYFETRALSTLNAAQTATSLNTINNFAHRFVASGTNETIELVDLIQMKLAFDKAEVPYGGRVLFVDPIVAASLSTKFQGTYNVDSNPDFQAILEGGFDRDHEFVMNLFGWNVVTSNRLPKIAAETINAIALTDGVANIFCNIADDQTKALMVAWRQMPKVEGDRNKDKQRDEFVTTARFGFGAQRVDTLGVLLTSATDIS
jgi:hypothetical protein